MSTSAENSPRSVGQWIVTGCFGLLSLAFLGRAVEFGFKWLRRVAEGDLNFKALTAWALIYAVVCGAIAAVAYFLARGVESAAD